MSEPVRARSLKKGWAAVLLLDLTGLLGVFVATGARDYELLLTVMGFLAVCSAIALCLQHPESVGPQK